MNADRIDNRGTLEMLDALLAAITPTIPNAHELILGLRARLEQARLIIDHSSDVVAIGSDDGRLEWISDSVTTTFGWQPGEVIDRPFVDFIHVDDRDRILETRSRLAQGERATVTVRFRTPTNEYRWISMRVAAVSDDHGDKTTRVGGWRDITDQVVTSQALELSQLRLRRVFETMFDPIAMLTPLHDAAGEVIDFLYTDANPPACAFNGFPHEELVGMRLLDVFPKMRTNGIFDRCVEVVRTGEPCSIDGFRYPDRRLHIDRSYDLRIVRVGDELSFTWRDTTDRQDQLIHRINDIVTTPIVDATAQLSDVMSRLSADDRQLLVGVLERHESAIRGLHSVASDLRPTTNADIGLVARLRDLLFGFSAHTGVAGNVVVDGDVAPDDPLLEANLLLFAQLALDTVARECPVAALSVELGGRSSTIEFRLRATLDRRAPDAAAFDEVVDRGRAIGAFCALRTRADEIELVWRARPVAVAAQSSAGPTVPR